MKPSFAERGGWWVVAQSLLMLAIGAAGPCWADSWKIGDASWMAVIFGGFGAWIGLRGTAALGVNRTAYPTPKANGELVTDGIFARVRHPLYTSVMALGAAWAFGWASWPALLAVVPLALTLGAKANLEEKKLLKLFPEYADYRRRTPRFVPRVFALTKASAMCGLGLGLAMPAVAPAEPTEPITLSEAIHEAQRNNPDAELARRRIARAEAGVTQADAMLWPRLTLQSGYQRTDNPVGVFGTALNQRSFSPSLNFNDVPDADNLNVAGVVTVPLYTSGQISASRRAAREQRAADTHSWAAVQSRLALETARTFFTIQKTRAFVTAAEAAVASHAGNLNIARQRFDAGKALKAEVLDIEVRLAQSREELVRARNANELSRRALANLLGREDSLPTVSSSQATLQTPAKDVRPARAETAALQRMKLAADAKVRAERSGRGPKVSAFAQAEHNRGWKFNGSGDNYTAGVLVNWNLWDGFLTRGKVAQARSERDMVAEQQRRLRLAIDLEVQQARLNINSAAERVGVTRKAVELATESAQLTRVRFEQGLALATQLIDAETALTGARVRLAQAEADRSIAVAALRTALGLPVIVESPTLEAK